METSKRRPNPLETDDGTECLRNEFLNNKNIKRFFRNTSPGAVFAERFKKTTRKFFKKQVFEEEKADWISEFPSVVKIYKYTIHSSTKRTPVQASMKKNAKNVFLNLQD